MLEPPFEKWRQIQNAHSKNGAKIHNERQIQNPNSKSGANSDSGAKFKMPIRKNGAKIHNGRQIQTCFKEEDKKWRRLPGREFLNLTFEGSGVDGGAWRVAGVVVVVLFRGPQLAEDRGERVHQGAVHGRSARVQVRRILVRQHVLE